MVATITMTATALGIVLKPPPALFRLMFTPTNCEGATHPPHLQGGNRGTERGVLAQHHSPGKWPR